MEIAGGKAAKGKPVLLGITKASLSTDSSFQETTRVNGSRAGSRRTKT